MDGTASRTSQMRVTVPQRGDKEDKGKVCSAHLGPTSLLPNGPMLSRRRGVHDIKKSESWNLWPFSFRHFDANSNVWFLYL